MANSSVSGAASLGSQAFMATGNPWVAAGAAALGFLSGRSADKAKNKALAQQLELNRKQNELIIAETARGVSEINRQRTLLSLETNRSLRHLERGAGDASADVLNQYAAADLVGATALVAQSEMERQLDENTAMIRLNNEINNENLNNQVINLTQGGQSQLRDMSQELMPTGGKYDNIFALANAAFDVYGATKGSNKVKTAGASKTTNQASGISAFLLGGN